jgi:hypothetical protein
VRALSLPRIVRTTLEKDYLNIPIFSESLVFPVKTRLSATRSDASGDMIGRKKGESRETALGTEPYSSRSAVMSPGFGQDWLKIGPAKQRVRGNPHTDLYV